VDKKLHLLYVYHVWKLEDDFLRVEAEALTLPAYYFRRVLMLLHKFSCCVPCVLARAMEDGKSLICYCWLYLLLKRVLELLLAFIRVSRRPKVVWNLLIAEVVASRLQFRRRL
jgi:hypothetical protein